MADTPQWRPDGDFEEEEVVVNEASGNGGPEESSSRLMFDLSVLLMAVTIGLASVMPPRNELESLLYRIAFAITVSLMTVGGMRALRMPRTVARQVLPVALAGFAFVIDPVSFVSPAPTMTGTSGEGQGRWFQRVRTVEKPAYLRESDRRRGEILAALKILQEQANYRGQAQALTSLGNLDARVGRYDYAEDAYLQALTIHRDRNDQPGEAEVLIGIGSLERRRGRPESAERAYQRAMGIYEALEDAVGQMRAAPPLGSLQWMMTADEGARGRFERAMVAALQAGDKQAEGEAALGLARLDQDAGERDKAANGYERALGAFVRAQDVQGQARTLTAHGGLLGSDRPDEARRMLNEALSLHRRSEDRLGEAEVMFELGRVQHGLGEAGAARDLYDSCLKILREMGNRFDQARVYFAIGELDATVDPERAEDAFRQAAYMFGVPAIGEGRSLADAAARELLRSLVGGS